MMRVCFGRLVSIILVLFYLNIFSQESQTIADYENMNLMRKVKAAKIKKNLFPTMEFKKIWCTMLSFLNLGFCFFQYFLVKSDLCSLRPFKLHSSEKDAEYQNNH